MVYKHVSYLDIEHLYHAFMHSPVSLLSGFYPLPAMHSLLVTLYVAEYVIGINQRLLVATLSRFEVAKSYTR